MDPIPYNEDVNPENINTKKEIENINVGTVRTSTPPQ